MLRLAHEQDLPWLVQQMLHLKHTTGWRDEPGNFSGESLSTWLANRLYDPLSVCYVWATHNDLPAAFCGTILQRLIQPPHMPILSEWGWSGPRREAVKCWRACTQWGKKHGVVYAQRVTAASAVHPRRIVETVTWEKL